MTDTARPGHPLAMNRPDLARHTLAVLFIGALLAATLWILRPFLASVIWATMICVATWPVMLRVQVRLGGRRGPAVAVMSLMLLLLFAIPLTLALLTILENTGRIGEWARALAALRLPVEAPAKVLALPFVGEQAATAWAQVTAAGLDGLLAHLQPYAGELTKWFLGEIGTIGFVIVQVLLTVAISSVLYLNGEQAAAWVLRLARRLGGERGAGAVELAGKAIRGVALGVGLTAIVQALLSGIALALAGVPSAGLLTVLTFLFCVAQIGVFPVLLPAALWSFWSGDTGWGIFLVVCAILVAALESFLRPRLIRMGANLPILLIFAGVIGGLLAFGLVGIFVGPVVLAVCYTLLEGWMEDGALSS